MAEIVPAIIAKDFEELKDKIKKVEPFVNWVQLDVMDGKFAPEKTGYQPEDLKRLDAKVDLEAHLMIDAPEKEIDRWPESGVKRILVHYEAIKDDLRIKIYELRNRCNEHGVELGLVLNLETPISVLERINGGLASIMEAKPPLIQLMAIAHIGYHGHPFDEKVIPKIKALKERYSSVKIAVDGGINKETAKMALSAGADILVAGSAIFDSGNIEEAVKDLRDIHNNKIQ